MKNLLIIADDYYHHMEVIAQGLAFLGEFYDLTFRHTYDFCDTEKYDLVVFCKDNHTSRADKTPWIDAEITARMRRFVENGGSLLVLHAGTVFCRENDALKSLIGCAFREHPEACEVRYSVVKNNEITAGASDFTEKDEHYFIDIAEDFGDYDVFLESRSHAGTAPAG